MQRDAWARARTKAMVIKTRLALVYSIRSIHKGYRLSSAPIRLMRNIRISSLARIEAVDTSMNAMLIPMISLLLSCIAKDLHTFRETRENTRQSIAMIRVEVYFRRYNIWTTSL
jgi:hypothetical protein